MMLLVPPLRRGKAMVFLMAAADRMTLGGERVALGHHRDAGGRDGQPTGYILHRIDADGNPGRHLHALGVPAGTLKVAALIEGRQHLLAELGRLIENGVGQLARVVDVCIPIGQLAVGQQLVQDKLHVAERGSIHGR
jgi:hypothetical protein